MKFLLPLPAILVLTLGCGSLGDLTSDKLNQLGSAQAAGTEATAVNLNDAAGADLSFLSANAQAVLAQVKTLQTGLRAKVDALCPPDAALRDTIHAAFDAIRSDSSKTEEEKRAALEAVRTQYKEQMSAERDRMQTCRTSNEDALVVWKDLGKTLHEACLVRHAGHKPHGGHGPGHGKPRGPRPGALTDAQKQEFETKLGSEACTQALADIQGQLQ